jgi:hypothetical protein
MRGFFQNNICSARASSISRRREYKRFLLSVAVALLRQRGAWVQQGNYFYRTRCYWCVYSFVFNYHISVKSSEQ